MLAGLQAKLCNGKFVVVEARRKGFFSLGKQRVLCHNLVDLLRHLSRAFDNVRLSLKFSDLLVNYHDTICVESNASSFMS